MFWERRENECVLNVNHFSVIQPKSSVEFPFCTAVLVWVLCSLGAKTCLISTLASYEELQVFLAGLNKEAFFLCVCLLSVVRNSNESVLTAFMRYHFLPSLVMSPYLK